MEGVLAPVLGDRLLADLAPIDFGKAVSDYAARLKREGRSNGTNANKLLAAARRMFKTARGWGIIGAADPTAGLSKPAKEAPRDRMLFDGKVLVGPDPKVNEVGRLVAALLAEPSPVPVSQPTRLALLADTRMGFRALETCSLEWRAIDLDGETPTVTVTTSKTNAGLRTLPLPRAAVAMLRELEGGARKERPSCFQPRKRSKRARHSPRIALACLRARLRTARDHRRIDTRPAANVLSGLIELGHESVAERIAGHVPRHVMGQHYDRSKRIEPMRWRLKRGPRPIDAARARFMGAPQ